MKSRPYLITLANVNLSGRPLCFRSMRLWTINVLVVAIPTQSEFADHRYDWNVKNLRVISMQTPGYGLLAAKLSPAARNRLDALLEDEGPIESAIWDALDNRQALGDLPARLAASEGMVIA